MGRAEVEVAVGSWLPGNKNANDSGVDSARGDSGSKVRSGSSFGLRNELGAMAGVVGDGDAKVKANDEAEDNDDEPVAEELPAPAPTPAPAPALCIIQRQPTATQPTTVTSCSLHYQLTARNTIL